MPDFILSHLSNPFANLDLALGVLRVAAGGFFAISGYHKLFNKARHARVAQVMVDDHVPFPKFMEWWVPFWELFSGTLLALGLATGFNAMVLIIICAVACGCEARGKVAAFNPVDEADAVDDYLYLPEVLYIVILVANLLAGGGRYSLDWLLWN